MTKFSVIIVTSLIELLSLYVQVTVHQVHVDREESYFGTSCLVDAYDAFRLPLLQIRVSKSGFYEMQQELLENFANFTFTNRTTNITTGFTNIPKEYENQLCHSESIPLMCQESGPVTGEGTCVCLNLEVAPHKVKTIPVNDANHEPIGDQIPHQEIKNIRCLALKGHFCETPFIACIKHEHCVYQQCSSGTHTLSKRMKFCSVIIILFSFIHGDAPS